MVVVEIVGAVLRELRPGHALPGHRPDVGAGAALVDAVLDAQRRQLFRDLVHRGARRRIDAGAEGIDAARAEIALGADLVLVELRGMRLGVGATAEQALFLVGEGDHANGAARCAFEIADQRTRRHRDGDAGAVVDRAGAEIPGIEMAADHDDFVGQFAPADFADDVVGGLLAVQTGIDVQADLHRLAAAKHVRQQVGVGIRQRRRRNLLPAIGITHHAGMRHAVRIGADRADDHGDRALLRGFVGAAAACGDSRSVAMAVLETLHAVADVGDLAFQAAFRCRLQRIERGEFDDFGIERFAAGANAAAQRGDDQALRIRAENFGAFVAAAPHRIGHRL